MHALLWGSKSCDCNRDKYDRRNALCLWNTACGFQTDLLFADVPNEPIPKYSISKKHFHLGGMAPSEWTRSVRAVRATLVADYTAPRTKTTRRVAYRPPIAVSPFPQALSVSYCKRKLWRCGPLWPYVGMGSLASAKNISVRAEWLRQSGCAPSEPSETPWWRITPRPPSIPHVGLHIALRSLFHRFFLLCQSPILNERSGVVAYCDHASEWVNWVRTCIGSAMRWVTLQKSLVAFLLPARKMQFSLY